MGGGVKNPDPPPPPKRSLNMNGLYKHQTGMNRLSEIEGYIRFKCDNNLEGVITSMQSHGYKFYGIKTVANACKQLNSIYQKNSDMLFKILQSVAYNRDAGNYTTDIKFNQQVQDFINSQGYSSVTDYLKNLPS